MDLYILILNISEEGEFGIRLYGEQRIVTNRILNEEEIKTKAIFCDNLWTGENKDIIVDFFKAEFNDEGFLEEAGDSLCHLEFDFN